LTGADDLASALVSGAIIGIQKLTGGTDGF